MVIKYHGHFSKVDTMFRNELKHVGMLLDKYGVIEKGIYDFKLK